MVLDLILVAIVTACITAVFTGRGINLNITVHHKTDAPEVVPLEQPTDKQEEVQDTYQGLVEALNNFLDGRSDV